MNKIKSLLGLFLIVLLLASCSDKKNNPTEPDNTNNAIQNKSGQPIPAFEGTNVNGVMATIGYEFATLPTLPPVSLTMGFAQFGDKGVDAGTVMVNESTLGKISQSGSTYYISPSPTNPTGTLDNVYFNGSMHNWTVAGGNGVPALSGGVQSPISFNITAPASNATVSAASGLTVSWNGGSSAKVLVYLISLSSSGKAVFSQDLSDDGSHTFSASELSGITGQVMIQVVKYHYNEIASGGKSYYAVAEIVKSVNATLN
ncbi:MAG: hypothetical protein Fur0015_10330 [Ignavibacteriales bacterium]